MATEGIEYAKKESTDKEQTVPKTQTKRQDCSTRKPDDLHLATLGRYEALVSMLIKKGLDVNAKGHDGETALLQAAKIGHVAIAQLLRGRR